MDGIPGFVSRDSMRFLHIYWSLLLI
jgi:hypothetical protein